MNCPRCVNEVSHAIPMCGHCGFTLGDLDSHFGNDEVALSKIMDANNAFQEKEVAELGKALEEFETTFPQLFIAVYSLALPATANLRQYAFWTLNHAAISPLEITRPNENGALLVLDETSGQAALVVGFLLECYFSEMELEEILLAGKSHWHHGKMSAGVLDVISKFTKELRKKARTAGKNPAVFDPRPPKEPELPKLERLHETADKPKDASDMEDASDTTDPKAS